MELDKKALQDALIKAMKDCTPSKPEPKTFGEILDVLATVYAGSLATCHGYGYLDLNDVRELVDGTKSLALDLCTKENE